MQDGTPCAQTQAAAPTAHAMPRGMRGVRQTHRSSVSRNARHVAVTPASIPSATLCCCLNVVMHGPHAELERGTPAPTARPLRARGGGSATPLQNHVARLEDDAARA
eukprot:1781297-Prymnesium_polylepis.2